MTMRDERFWAWPGWGHIGFSILLEIAQSLWWILIYGGANYLTGLHAYRVRLHLDWELRVPFMPVAVLGYMSIYPLFWAAPFILRKRREMAALMATGAAVTFVASVCFLVFPADSLFPTPAYVGVWTRMIDFAKRVALEHNWMPSLHVALATVCILIYSGRAGAIGKAILWFWALIIGLSTMLLHQHYLVDVLTGYVLAWLAVHWLYRRLVVSRQTAVTDSTGFSITCTTHNRV